MKDKQYIVIGVASDNPSVTDKITKSIFRYIALRQDDGNKTEVFESTLKDKADVKDVISFIRTPFLLYGNSSNDVVAIFNLGTKFEMFPYIKMFNGSCLYVSYTDDDSSAVKQSQCGADLYWGAASPPSMNVQTYVDTMIPNLFVMTSLRNIKGLRAKPKIMDELSEEAARMAEQLTPNEMAQHLVTPTNLRKKMILSSPGPMERINIIPKETPITEQANTNKKEVFMGQLSDKAVPPEVERCIEDLVSKYGGCSMRNIRTVAPPFTIKAIDALISKYGSVAVEKVVNAVINKHEKPAMTSPSDKKHKDTHGQSDALKDDTIESGNRVIDVPEVWKSKDFDKSLNYNLQLKERYDNPVRVYLLGFIGERQSGITTAVRELAQRLINDNDVASVTYMSRTAYAGNDDHIQRCITDINSTVAAARTRCGINYILVDDADLPEIQECIRNNKGYTINHVRIEIEKDAVEIDGVITTTITTDGKAIYNFKDIPK